MGKEKGRSNIIRSSNPVQRRLSPNKSDSLKGSAMFNVWLAVLFAFPRVSLIWTFSIEDCGRTKGCWFQPPNCQDNNVQLCDGMVQWTVQPDGFSFDLEAKISDLKRDSAHYVAVGFSKDQRMGDDSVLECVVDKNGAGNAFLSFNDETTNQRLLQASEVMLSNISTGLEDGHIKCSAKWLLDAKNDVDNGDTYKVFNLEEQPWYLLFARGDADPRSLEKRIHFLNDGPQLPWMTDTKIVFCRYNCSTSPTFIVSEMIQSHVSRWWRYRLALLHGVLMVFAWWVLASSAILVARYFKPIWPEKKLFGTAVWFQVHRDFALTSVLLQLLALLLIFYQANWVWYGCSYECSSDSFSKQMHVITGFSAVCCAAVQPLIAVIRPGPNSSLRPIFSWVHWFVGTNAWILASITILLSVPLGKTGLMLGFGHIPTIIMAAYIVVFLFSNVILEIFSSQSERRTQKIGSSDMALSIVNGPSTESATAKPTWAKMRQTIFGIHSVAAVATTITIIYMLVARLLAHS
ncbi:hypothetical protein AB6A40_001999 [Gnathostoma spinigerum]|uniref:Ferric-chelate reductase 1 n=1 Tax=Gnathostoma spinigerum TaxID=75299 RepID=A0ABD6E5H5_9BILA